ncbi:chorismate mutase [Clostridium chromiireducens]|uniref:Chorismate mutase n=1 Tax=Clostridium chromiireducens TaxID=225345 RepID=A0A399ILR4_9CLOT|nr:chorismate mutase [Clostridium chromiireducens]RII33229.1 chorismate mutase [Clostridium chromiireducens]
MECETLEEVRENIDRIDKKIIELIAERSKYVVQAANFKNTSEEVKASQRVEEIINKVRMLAKFHGVNSDMVENIYREMINSFINLELSECKKIVK